MGHATCLLKQDSIWYFGDNETGLLHPISDEDFVESFYNEIVDADKIQNIGYMTTHDRKTSSVSMGGYLFTMEKKYPDDPGVVSIENLLNYQPLREAIVLYQTTPSINGGGIKRRKTRRLSRKGH
jgi:hypothetical protein